MFVNKKNLLVNIALIILILLLASCQDKKSPVYDNAYIDFSATYSASRMGGMIQADDIQLDDLIINVEEIELEADDHSSDDNGSSRSGNTNDDNSSGTDNDEDDNFTDPEWRGPFELPLLLDGKIQPLSIPVGSVPNLTYNEIEIHFVPVMNPRSRINGRSIYLSGSVNGTPFIFWSASSFEFEMEFPSGIRIPEDRSVHFLVEFALDELINPLKGGVDLSRATDGNGDGTIEIGQGNVDGNGTLYDALMQGFRTCSKAGRDDD